jgi:hypothetical protein
MELYLHSPNTPPWLVAQLKKDRNKFDTVETERTACGLFQSSTKRMEGLGKTANM